VPAVNGGRFKIRQTVSLGYGEQPVDMGSARRRTAVTLTSVMLVAAAQLAIPDVARPMEVPPRASEVVRLVPRQDAEVIEARPDLNRGESTILRAKASPKRLSFIKFRVPDGTDPITDARLRFSVRSRVDTRVAVHRAARKWFESTVTYNTAPRVMGQFVTIDVPAGKRRWVTVDVSRYVDGPGTYSFAIVGLSPGTAIVASSESDRSPQLVLTAEPPKDVVMVAAGDIACWPTDPAFNGGQGTATSCRQSHTSDLILAVDPDVVAALGDLQYKRATLADFALSYDPSWGRVFDRTHPTPGNHEYYTPHAAGYFDYWGPRAGNPTKGYYSYNVGAWHAVVLNTNCETPDVDCTAGGAQAAWLRADLAASAAECTIAYGHHPRFSSGYHGNENGLHDLYTILYQNGVDIYLAGHEHSYERTAPLKPNATVAADGIRSFIVGTGGKELRRDTVNPRSYTEAWDDHTYGVLRLDLLPDSYEWEFINDGSGTFTDVGTGSCH